MRVRLLIWLAVPALFLAGCGGSSKKTSAASNGVAKKSATDILAAAKSAADSATSVHVSGSGTDSTGVPLVVNLHIVAGKGGKGRLSEKGLSFDLVRVGPSAYIKGSAAFYRKFAGPGAAQLLKDKWLKGPATTGDLASLTPLTDLRKLIDQTLTNHGTLAKTATTTVHGQQVVGVKDTTKYIEGQAEHHRKTTFKEEIAGFLKKHGMEYVERELE